MKSMAQLFLPILLVLLQFHCSNILGPAGKHGYIVVYVHGGLNGSDPVSGVKVELVQTGEVKNTNENGVAAFKVNPGSYTIRVYGLVSGGPPIPHTVEIPVVVKDSFDTPVIRVFDCLVCD